MTKRQEANEQFKPLSAVATSIITMGINEDGEFFQETNDIAADDTDSTETPERTAADIAADFVNRFLMHRHRGVINFDSYFVLFGNDGYSTDQRSRKECADVWGKLRAYDTQTGTSSDGTTWAIVLTDHTRSLFDEEELDHLVWDVWMAVCDELSN